MPTHGLTETTEYSIWTNMKTRCNNHNNEFYKDYGGRGIKICAEWENSFENFYADMGKRPSKKHTLDRINNDNGYSVDNCRWAIKKVQANNRRNNILIEYNGVSKTLKQWCEELELNYKNTHKRIKNLGWSIEKAFLEPPMPTERLITFNGKTQSVRAWGRELNINSNRISSRLNQLGLSIEESLDAKSRVGNNQFLKAV